jgi:hypothetical protein
MVLMLALIAAIGRVIAYGVHANSLEQQLKDVKRNINRRRCRRQAVSDLSS